MAEISMTPVIATIKKFSKELEDTFTESINSSRDSIKKEAYEKAMKSIYAHRDSTGFTEMKVSKDNYKVFVKIYQVIDVYKKEENIDDVNIAGIGAKYGFNPEQSLNLYHMAKYEVAIENLRSQKAKVAEFALSEG